MRMGARYPAATYQLAQHLPNVPATTAHVVFASATTERAMLAALRAETIRVQQTSDAIRFLCANNERVAKLGACCRALHGTAAPVS